MNWRNTPTREFDFIMALGAAALMVYGVLLIYSGSLTNYGPPESLGHPAAKQALFAAFGMLAMVVLSRLDYKLLGPLSVALYVLAIAALIFVLVAGDSAYGSRRWIDIGGTQVQPSELAKMCTVIMLAKFFADNDERIESLRVFGVSLAIAGVPAVLVLVEPDLGSALVYGVIWLLMAVVAGVRLIYVGALIGLVSGLMPVLYGLAAEYQRERLLIWRDPESDPLGKGFNILQAETSAGSGRFWGKGFTHGTQTQLDYLRTQTTDYIFSVGAEEFGFVGASVLFALFVVLLFRCLRVASRADDSFGRLIAVGVVSFILFQTFVNIGVNIRLVPVTGVPLPLVSQGGSSLITVLASLGVVQSVLGHRRKRRREG